MSTALQKSNAQCIMHIKQMGHRVGIKTLEMHMQKSTKQKVLSCGNAFQCLNSGAHIGKYLNKNREVKH